MLRPVSIRSAAGDCAVRTRAAGPRCRSRPEHRCAGPRCNSRCPHRRSPPAAPPRRSTTGHGRVHGARLTGKPSRTGPRVPGIRFPGPAKRRASQRPSRTGPRAAARRRAPGVGGRWCCGACSGRPTAPSPRCSTTSAGAAQRRRCPCRAAAAAATHPSTSAKRSGGTGRGSRDVRGEWWA